MAARWTSGGIEEICFYLSRATELTVPGDGSYSDQLLQKLSNVFWSEQKFPVGIKESKCRAA